MVPGTLAKGPTEGSYWAEIETTTELQDYDLKPVRSYDRWLFKPTRDGQRYLLTSTTDRPWEESHQTATEPWDIEHVYIDEYGSVLGVFDSTTASDADRILRIVSEAKDDDSLTIPESEQWAEGSGTVVYVLGDQKIIDGLSGEIVGSPERADGLTIAMQADPNDPSRGTASFRVSLNPRVLTQPELVLGRLVRHELTHATLGTHGKGAPIWMTEGIAEWVSVRPLPPSQRRLQPGALEFAARAQHLPTAADFAGADSGAAYALSWWTCEYVANTYGQHMLWTLLERLSGGADQDQVIPELLQITPDVLLRRAAALMTTTYAY